MRSAALPLSSRCSRVPKERVACLARTACPTDLSTAEAREQARCLERWRRLHLSDRPRNRSYRSVAPKELHLQSSLAKAGSDFVISMRVIRASARSMEANIHQRAPPLVSISASHERPVHEQFDRFSSQGGDTPKACAEVHPDIRPQLVGDAHWAAIVRRGERTRRDPNHALQRAGRPAAVACRRQQPSPSGASTIRCS